MHTLCQVSAATLSSRQSVIRHERFARHLVLEHPTFKISNQITYLKASTASTPSCKYAVYFFIPSNAVNFISQRLPKSSSASSTWPQRGLEDIAICIHPTGLNSRPRRARGSVTCLLSKGSSRTTAAAAAGSSLHLQIGLLSIAISYRSESMHA